MVNQNDERISKPLELYGHAMRLMSFTTKSKNLQDFSTRVFEAAGMDVQQDKLNKSSGSTKHLDEFLNNYAQNKLDLSDDAKEKFVLELKRKIIGDDNNYETLKTNLDYVRIQGVGKGIAGKAAAAAGMAARTALTGIAAGFVAATGACAMYMGEDAVKSWADLMKGDFIGSMVNDFKSRLWGDAAQVSAALGAGAGFLGMQATYNLNQERAHIKEALRVVGGVEKWRPLSKALGVAPEYENKGKITERIKNESTRGNPMNKEGRSFL